MVSGIVALILNPETALGMGNPTKIGILNPSSTDKNQESSTWNPESGIHEPRIQNPSISCINGARPLVLDFSGHNICRNL